ncbi:MAG: autotransporter-associated beta strand repeat-containing protein [Verrucomicrobiaceae bacterium]|nr:autotransporter-associated beta strand repeat-containing protein [Verrucomicrobiaceae bacterium]
MRHHINTQAWVRKRFACLLLLLSLPALRAANLTWDSDGTSGGPTGGVGTWDTSALLWDNAGTMTAWNNGGGHVAILGGTAGTVTLGENITAAGLTFNSSGYLLDGNGNTLTFGGAITVTNAGQSAAIDAAITLSSSVSFGGTGDLTLAAGSSILGDGGTGQTLSKSGLGTTVLGGTITETGSLNVSGGVLTLSGSMTRSTYSNNAGFNVTGGTLNITGTLGTSAANPTGQSGFSGNSVTNFSGTGFFSGNGSTFRIGEGSDATFNVTGGTMTLGTSSASLILGRSSTGANGFMNISGGQVIVTGSSTTIRIGAGYTDTEVGGASVMTLSGTGLLDTGTTSAQFQLGSGKAGNTTGTGTLNLDGGTLSTLRSITGGTAADSYVNLNGGTLKATGSTLTLAISLTTVNVRDGGALIDTNGFNISIAKALTHSVIGGDAAIDGGLTKSGLGILTFTGADANTYTGITWIKAGEIDLNKTAGVNAIAANVTIGDGTTAAVLKLLANDQIADTSILTFDGTGANAGIFRLNNKSESIGGLDSTGGAGFVENESGVTGTGTLTVQVASGTHIFSGVLRDGDGSGTDGTLAFTKNGMGTQVLSGINTYTGTTTINAGILRFGIANALNATTPLVLAAAGGASTLSLDGNDWTSGAITFYDATSTATSQATIDIGSGGTLTLGSSTFVLNNNNQPLGALINGGTLDLGNATRIFNIADSSSALADLTIASDITATSGAYSFNKAGAGTLKLTGTVSVGANLTISAGVLEIAGTASNPAASYLTQVGSATPSVARIVSGGSLSTGTFQLGVGAGYKGALVMTAGQLTVNPTNNQSGISLGGTGYGGLFLSGGTIDTKRVDSLDGTTADSISILRVNGGTLNTSRYLMTRNERWEITVTGGLLQRTAEHIALAFRSNGSTTAQGAMTIAGGQVNNGTSSSYVTFGQQNDNTAKGTAHFNLNAGTFNNSYFNFYNNTGSATHAYINFNGGLYRSTTSATLINTISSGGTGSVAAYVNGAFGAFDGGLKLDTNSFTTTISNALLAPTGSGVSTIPLTSGGSGYIGAPYVDISGGGGSGATAYATVDLDPASPTYGQLTGIVISNPGRDYTSTPTITLNGGGGSGAIVGTPTLVANTSGGLTKSGTGTLILSGAAANTFTGMSSVLAGELQLSKTAGVNALAGDVTVGDGSAPAVMKLVNSDQIADTSIVTLLGTGANAGIFRLNNKSETIGGLDSAGGAGIVENESGTAGTSTLTLDVASGTHTFSGVLRDGNGSGTDGTLALVKSGTGTQVLTGSNTYTGTTTVSAGTLQLGDGGTGGSLATGSAISVASGATFAVKQSDTVTQGTHFSSAAISGAGGFAQTGSGTTVLTATNTYTGTTTVSAGALQVGNAGSGQTGTGAVTVQTGGTILGTGIVQGTTFTADSGSTLRPGDSVADSNHGTLTFTPASASGSTHSLQGSIILGISAPTTTLDLTGITIGSAAYNALVDGVSGVGSHDRLVFNNPASGTGYNLDFLTTTGTLQVVGSGFTPAMGQAFNLLDWGSMVTANFTGFTFNGGQLIGNGDEGTDLDLPDLTGSGLFWDFSRFTTSGVIVVVPEPGRAVLLLVGLLGLMLRRRR